MNRVGLIEDLQYLGVVCMEYSENWIQPRLKFMDIVYVILDILGIVVNGK